MVPCRITGIPLIITLNHLHVDQYHDIFYIQLDSDPCKHEILAPGLVSIDRVPMDQISLSPCTTTMAI